jgi:hypothetical protein
VPVWAYFDRVVFLAQATLVDATVAGGRVTQTVVVGEGAGQRAVRVGLGQEVPGLLLDGLHGVGTRHEAHGRLALTCELDQRVGELDGVTSLEAVDTFQAAAVCSLRSA